MSRTETRIEKDSMGEMPVPADVLYGATTQRALLNFPIKELPGQLGGDPRVRTAEEVGRPGESCAGQDRRTDLRPDLRRLRSDHRVAR